MRKLAEDGYPPTRIIGADIRESYITLGHKLYNDASSCPIHFITSDIFDLSPTLPISPAPPSLSSLESVKGLDDVVGRIAHIYTGSLFHLFDKDTQLAIAIRLIVLLRRSGKSIIFGRHQGFEREGLIDDWLGRYAYSISFVRALESLHLMSGRSVRYAHSTASWARMWAAAFKHVTGSEEGFVVESELLVEDGSMPFKVWLCS